MIACIKLLTHKFSIELKYISCVLKGKCEYKHNVYKSVDNHLYHITVNIKNYLSLNYKDYEEVVDRAINTIIKKEFKIPKKIDYNRNVYDVNDYNFILTLQDV